MEIHEIRDGDVLVLAPDGGVTDSEETSALETKLGTALKAGGRLLVFDCTSAAQLTSSALRVLLLHSRKLDRTDGRLVLCGMNARLAKAFSISGFDKDVTVVTTREEALRRVREPRAPSAPRPKKEKRKKEAAPAPVVAEPAEPAEAAAPVDAAPAEPSAPAEPIAPVVPVAPEVPVAPIEPPPPPAPAAPAISAADPIVDVLLDKLGSRVVRTVAIPRSAVPPNLDALADGLLAALRVGRP